MLFGIDVSNHQGDNGIELGAVLPYVDFCIIKATGGTHFVDEYCDGFIQKCKQQGKLWGFYHFANDGVYSSAEDEAVFFYENCKNYFGEGIPVLDWEVDVGVGWVNHFVNKVHELSGVWCWIYGNPWRFEQGDVEPNCARWVASYPSWIINPEPGFNPGYPPDCPGLVACWQYASDGYIPSYDGNLDMDIYYGDFDSWHLYSVGDNIEFPDPEPPEQTDVHIMEDEIYKVIIEKK